MQIFKVDNFDRDYVSEIVIAENLHDHAIAIEMVQGLNKKHGGPDEPYKYILVDDERIPFKSKRD